MISSGYQPPSAKVATQPFAVIGAVAAHDDRHHRDEHENRPQDLGPGIETQEAASIQ